MFDENKDETFEYNNYWYEYDAIFGKRFYYLDNAATSGPDGALVRKRISRKEYMTIREKAGVQ